MFYSREGIAIEDFTRTVREFVTSGEALFDNIITGS